jgi:hypothetical protein
VFSGRCEANDSLEDGFRPGCQAEAHASLRAARSCGAGFAVKKRKRQAATTEPSGKSRLKKNQLDTEGTAGLGEGSMPVANMK